MLRIGWASVDMTPERPVLLCGQFAARVSTHVNDPLTVTALAIEAQQDDGSTEQAVMLSADLVHMAAEAQEQVRDLVRDRLPDFDVRKLFINATHTHTSLTLKEGAYEKQGPEVMTPTECVEFFVAKAAEAVVEAWQSRKPGGVSWAFGHAVVGHNRRAVYFGGSAQMYGKTNVENFEHIEGYQDHSMDVLFIWDADKKLTGMVINIACPSQVTENAMYVSADFWHEAREKLRKRYGTGLFVLPQCAAAGDQSPHFLLYEKEEEYMRRRKGVSEREEIGQRIANAVDNVLEAAKADIRTDLPFEHVVETLQLPVREITDEEYQVAREGYEQSHGEKASGREPPAWRTWHSISRRCQDVLTRYEAQKTNPNYAMELHVLRLGDVAVVTNPFELFLDYGVRIKARSSALQTFVVQLATGTGSYLPTHRALAGKHYGAGPADNLVGPEGGQIMVNRTLELIENMWRDQKGDCDNV